ncbi:restriction endonuclease subunit S [Escherichia coli]|jgi:type I restriction enzyme S subunit|nr:restriction endonuclease subunit S [Escherichia coli]APL74609.1 subunit S of type I restriction-modification system [Escherichia coli]EEW6018970.1 restriction endonuclease subunit S [Escherichia coli]EFB3132810.1 restriction endonuclease subunit S [Escherichia coli]EFB3187483.1 restriction endonuclease subunit S [Escherichia coli]EFB3221730.1 restriction endonuclease subunit S [Escherichia coli]
MSVEKLIVDHMETWTSALQTRSTAGRGSSGKIDLYGIKKLRELILELAVRGKLVPQDPNDEPASELLKRIAAEKAELVKQGKIKKQKPLPEISEEEKPFELPVGWEWVRLGDFTNIIRGITFPGNEKSQFQAPGKIACLRTANVQEQIDWDDLIYISDSFVKRDDQYLQEHDIVMSMANSRELVGKVALASLPDNSKFTFGGFLSVLRPLVVNEIYLMALLRCETYKSQLIESASQTTNIANISLAKLNPLPVCIPPAKEQIHIVKKMNELMSLCDQLEQQSLTSLDAHQQLVETLLGTLTDSQNAEELAENWARISEHFDTLFTTEASVDALKQTILQLAVMGKLLNNTNNADYKKLRTYLSFGPKNGLSPVESKKETQLKVLKLGATSYGQLNLNETKFIDVDIEKDSHLFLKKGDILIQRGNSANFVGCNVLINEDYKNIIYPDLMMKIRTNDNLLPEYASIWLSSPLVRNFMWDRMTGTSGTMPKISKKIVEEIPIIVPEISIQQKWITTVNLMLDICSEIKYRLHKAKQTQLHLADALTDAAIN